MFYVHTRNQQGHCHDLAELLLRILFSALADADYLDLEQTVGQCQDQVGNARHEIYQYCLAAAEQPPGFFRRQSPPMGAKPAPLRPSPCATPSATVIKR